MGRSKTICMTTLFVANAYLPSYIPNIINALIPFIVHYILNYILHFLSIYLAQPPNPSGLRPSKPLWVRIMSLLSVNFEDVWSCCLYLEQVTLSDADGNIASTTQLYYKVVLNRYSI